MLVLKYSVFLVKYKHLNNMLRSFKMSIYFHLSVFISIYLILYSFNYIYFLFRQSWIYTRASMSLPGLVPQRMVAFSPMEGSLITPLGQWHKEEQDPTGQIWHSVWMLAKENSLAQWDTSAVAWSGFASSSWKSKSHLLSYCHFTLSSYGWCN